MYNAMQHFDGPTPFNVNDHVVFSCISGSRAYGMSTPTSDIDIRGIVIPPEKYFFGFNSFEQVENQSKDVCYFGLRKFINLAAKNNVHALEMLYMHPDSIEYETVVSKHLFAARSLFPSMRIATAYGGYAHQQLMLLDTKRNNKTGRVQLVEQFGYDTKFAAHAVRLLRSATEFLRTGFLQVKRPDAAELLEIRYGKYEFNDFVQFSLDEAQKQYVSGGFVLDEIHKFEQAEADSRLPQEPNLAAIEELLITLQKNWLKING